MKKLERLYYRLTRKLPRLLPSNDLEYARLKDILAQAFDLRDEPAVWATVSGIVSSTPATKVRRPLSDMVNAAHRLDVNKAAQNDKLVQIKRLEVQLQEATDRRSKEMQIEMDKREAELAANPEPQQKEVPTPPVV